MENVYLEVATDIVKRTTLDGEVIEKRSTHIEYSHITAIEICSDSLIQLTADNGHTYGIALREDYPITIGIHHSRNNKVRVKKYNPIEGV